MRAWAAAAAAAAQVGVCAASVAWIGPHSLREAGQVVTLDHDFCGGKVLSWPWLHAAVSGRQGSIGVNMCKTTNYYDFHRSAACLVFNIELLHFVELTD